MKMMALRLDKSSEPIAFLPSAELAKIVADRLGIKEFDISPHLVNARELEATEVHGNIKEEICTPSSSD